MSAETKAHNPEEMVRLLQEELEQTNRDVMQLTWELETRLDQLRTAEERYRRLAENAPDMIYRYDMRVKPGFTFVNPQAAAITGYAADDYYSDAGLLLRIVHPEDRAMLEPVLRGEAPAGRAILMRWLHKNGATVWIEQHQAPVLDAAGAVIAVECIARNVTERHNLEEQFHQAQKMEAIGRLAGGVAHDFNNLLTVILGYSAQIMSEMAPEDARRDDLEEINKAGERAAALTRQLLAFSRRQVLQPQVLDLNNVVAEMEKMLVRLLDDDIDYVTVPAPAPALVRADCGQMEQVLMNLVVNARDAMPKGGTLTVEIAAAESNVTLCVRDTGQGMDEATQKRIFEPFFTTKPLGVGTGLGLSTVYGIVTQSGGTVSVKSRPGAGTTFTVTLPAIAKAPQRVDEDRRASQMAAGKETVLVVEDELAVRNLIAAVLKRAGYRVLSAGNGAEAAQLCQSLREDIHLLVTDMVMPETRGDELAEQLTAVRPNLRVLIMSGYTDQDGGGRRAAFLQKPFAPSALVAAVRRALDAS